MTKRVESELNALHDLQTYRVLNCLPNAIHTSEAFEGDITAAMSSIFTGMLDNTFMLNPTDVNTITDFIRLLPDHNYNSAKILFRGLLGLACNANIYGKGEDTKPLNSFQDAIAAYFEMIPPERYEEIIGDDDVRLYHEVLTRLAPDNSGSGLVKTAGKIVEKMREY